MPWLGKNSHTTAPIVRVTPVTTVNHVRATELLEKVFGKFVDSNRKRTTHYENIAESAVRGQAATNLQPLAIW